jgi:excisionase family DNA binding protein
MPRTDALYYRAAEVADRLRLGRVDAVYRLIGLGLLEAVNVGTGKRASWRIPAEAVERFLSGRRAVKPVPAKRTRRRRPPSVTAYF